MSSRIVINKPDKEGFEHIKKHILEFELDNRALEIEQFLVAKQDQRILGFGRIREYKGSSELCSLGVIEPERNKGIGKELTKHLIQKATQDLYLVCIIPDFFKPFGFKEVLLYPEELKNKLHYCSSALAVPETYVVMKHSSSF